MSKLARTASPPGPDGADDEFSQFAAWVAAGELPELIPARQQRGLRNALAMLAAGRELLATRTLEDLAVEQVCHLAGTTVGAFYKRFASKHDFFLTMQRLQALRGRAVHDQFAGRHARAMRPLSQLCHEMVEVQVRSFRSNAGVIRAALQHTHEGLWDIYKAAGDHYRAVLIDSLMPYLAHLPRRQAQERVRFAFQVVAGTLIHALLNKPGPLDIDNDKLTSELALVVESYLSRPS